jgi:hypothetical protein
MIDESRSLVAVCAQVRVGRYASDLWGEGSMIA